MTTTLVGGYEGPAGEGPSQLDRVTTSQSGAGRYRLARHAVHDNSSPIYDRLARERWPLQARRVL